MHKEANPRLISSGPYNLFSRSNHQTETFCNTNLLPTWGGCLRPFHDIQQLLRWRIKLLTKLAPLQGRFSFSSIFCLRLPEASLSSQEGGLPHPQALPCLPENGSRWSRKGCIPGSRPWPEGPSYHFCPCGIMAGLVWRMVLELMLLNCGAGEDS